MHTHLVITDVAPRDGLQNEPELLPVEARVALVERLVEAGVPRIELGAFVNPRQVPQMAGTSEVARALASRGHDLAHGDDRIRGRRFTALVPNLRGYELAAEAGLRHVRLVLAASESLNRANFKRGVEESLADFAQIAARARADGMGFGVAIGAAFGCPFEGHVPPERVLGIARRLASLGADELVLADTTGMGVPTQVANLCREALRLFHDGPGVGIHLHNTRNTGYANALAAWQSGVTCFDTALGGIGGCPFAPRAVGNIATEDLVHMLNGMGVATGIKLGELIKAATWLSGQLGKPLPALVGKAEPVYV
ncbi:MAG: hydroxymethylglutaryl-CoA lyase [Chloroflexi bacterium OHK40]